MPTPPAPTVHRWSSLSADRPMDLLERRRVIGERAMLSHVALKKGCFVPTHSHANEQFCIVLSGRIRFGIGEAGSRSQRNHTVSPGEVIHLPSNCPHSAEALEDTLVIDVFSPPSEKTGIDVKR